MSYYLRCCATKVPGFHVVSHGQLSSCEACKSSASRSEDAFAVLGDPLLILGMTSLHATTAATLNREISGYTYRYRGWEKI